MQRVGPASASTLTLNRGERVGFSARATSPAGGLRGSEWYQDGSDLGAQYRSAVPGSTESDVTFSWGFNFPAIGRYTAQGMAFDTSGNYSHWHLGCPPIPRQCPAHFNPRHRSLMPSRSLPPRPPNQLHTLRDLPPRSGEGGYFVSFTCASQRRRKAARRSG
jgi:hypothetical protein